MYLEAHSRDGFYARGRETVFLGAEMKSQIINVNTQLTNKKFFGSEVTVVVNKFITRAYTNKRTNV